VLTCKSLNVLPRSGGLFDQDSFFVYMLMAAEQAYGERTIRENSRK
jgi:hypothetical protein